MAVMAVACASDHWRWVSAPGRTHSGARAERGAQGVRPSQAATTAAAATSRPRRPDRWAEIGRLITAPRTERREGQQGEERGGGPGGSSPLLFNV